MSFSGDMQAPRLVVVFFLFVSVGNDVLIVDPLPGRPVNLVELKLPRRGSRGINFNCETDQREGDLSGPIRACHARF
jgi:hypothetical protein